MKIQSLFLRGTKPAADTTMTMSARASLTNERIADIAEDHVGRLETELRQWGAKLDVLVAKVAADGLAAETGYHRGIDDVKSKYQIAQTRFAEFKTAGSAKWGQFKPGVQNAWNDVEDAFAELGN
jgi:hypothetical protein